MATVGTYLNFDGNAEEVMNFYAGVFDTGIMSLMRYGDFQMEGADAEGGPQMSDEAKAKVMNLQMLIMGDYLLQASDHLAEFGNDLKQGNNTAIVLMTDSTAETDRLFALLADGGHVRFAPADAGFGYFADLADKYGTNWMFYNTLEK